ncbi:RlpA-like double-psi beta-barrel-protein domain-containing protein-containing protein [Hypoxylon rubiginosum]|uniref:RlpA-like double-psi beta-barrel-protein domain-containing protein-containing protein n=1 Tax=Hypoxylon rubiginosum TaxID=110542 RepID=A0ACC0CZD6_9PEZI|nr:RlpA-like double-psi beta-barrel-protein domain-containing protein-containing protein [Hypoxylon rubiginosum]
MVSFTKIAVAIGTLIVPAIAHSGDMTYYTPGLGSCGWTNSESDMVVAMSPGQSGNCGKSINIHYQGKTEKAKIVDKCPGCAGDSIDVSPTVFKKFASLDVGRIQVTWDFA